MNSFKSQLLKGEQQLFEESQYLKSLKVKLLSSFDGSKSLDKELEEIEELFRNPNLLIQSIKDLQQRQEESLKEIQSKLNEINQVKVDLKAANEFVKSRIVVVVVVVFILWLNEIKQLFNHGRI
jgi:predicted  nucleic acid-binding Zn-ribbon protein